MRDLIQDAVAHFFADVIENAKKKNTEITSDTVMISKLGLNAIGKSDISTAIKKDKAIAALDKQIKVLALAPKVQEVIELKNEIMRLNQAGHVSKPVSSEQLYDIMKDNNKYEPARVVANIQRRVDVVEEQKFAATRQLVSSKGIFSTGTELLL